ncbi:hypothetical protein V5O48_016277 [Marasmius crinis-equi]|uniref:Uncharacterized protein n=1 Tax=Marasmius crinis-equi TaxID=585013 RepID=A0ABR3ES56_9AGAR
MSEFTNTNPHAMLAMPPLAAPPMMGKVTSNQPSPASGMAVSRDMPDRGEQTDGPMRLRGGCIPCPVRRLLLLSSLPVLLRLLIVKEG